MAIEKPDDASSSIDVDEIRDFYDSVYYADAGTDMSSAMRRHYRQLFGQMAIRENADVLDVACGTGQWLEYCQGRGCSIAGVDLSEKAISLCKTHLPQGEFHAQPAETLPFEDRRFDVVSCLGSLEHFVDPVSSLKEMARVAKDDATIVILVPNKDFLTRKLGLFGGTYQVDAKEVVRTLDEWDSLFTQGNLSVVERWKDLHIINKAWMTTGPFLGWPLRALQALMLPLWPLKWQYQVYHRCVKSAPSTA